METHRFDIISFIFGAIFLAITASVVWEFNYELSVSEWVLPGAILILGVALLTSTIRTTMQKNNEDPSA